MSGAIERDEGAEGDSGGRRVAFVTFGCRLNKAEALDLEAQYAAAGWQIVTLKTGLHPNTNAPSALHPDRSPPPEAETPAVIIVRGCSVTAKAQRDCEKAIAYLRARFPAADLDLKVVEKMVADPDASRWEGDALSILFVLLAVSF